MSGALAASVPSPQPATPAAGSRGLTRRDGEGSCAENSGFGAMLAGHATALKAPPARPAPATARSGSDKAGDNQVSDQAKASSTRSRTRADGVRRDEAARPSVARRAAPVADPARPTATDATPVPAAAAPTAAEATSSVVVPVVPVASAPTTPIPATDPAELALSTGAGAGVGAVGAADVLPGQAGLDAPGSGVSFSQRSVAGASGVASILAGDMTDTASPVGAPAGSGPGVLPVLSHQVAGPAGAQPEQGLATVAGRGDAAAAAAAVDGVALPGQSAPDATGAGVSLPGRFVDAATAGGSGLPGQAASAGAGAGDAATAAVAAGGLTGQGDSDLTGVRTAAVPSAGQPLAATAATATGVASGLLQQDMDVAGPAGGVPAAPGTAAGDAAAAAAALAAGGGGAGAGQEGSGSAGGGFGSQGGPVDAASALPAVSHALSAADNLSGAAPGPGAVGGFATPVQPLATPVIPPATGQAAPPLSAAVHHQVFTAVSPLLRGRDGSYSVELALHPSDLGAVRVIVDVRHGEISIQMHAADPAARDALRGGLSELRQQLVDQGLRTGSMDVGSGGANGQQPQTPGPRTHTTQTAMGGPGSSDQLVATAGAAPSTTLDLRM